MRRRFTTNTDAEIIRASRDEPRQFGLIFDRHFDTLYRYLCRRVGAALADDLASQTFTEAFAHRSRYDPARPSALPWLYGIAANLLRRHYRGEQRQLRAYAQSGVDPTRDADLDAVVERVDADLAGPRIAAALAALDRGDRDVLLLYAWTELSYADIGYALGIPLGTVRSRLNRARRKTRELLAASGQYQGDGISSLATLEVYDG
jgi:RNA polymerase sigma-70 factor (ECF subfamily)